MLRNYKYRIYPKKTTSKRLDEIFFGHRFLYNKALEQRIDAWKNFELSLTAFDQNKSFNQVRRNKFPQVNCTSFQQTMRRLDITMKAFFRRLKSGEKPGFPRFKPVNRFNTIVFNANDGCKIANRKLIITKLSPIRIKWHRELPDDSTIKQYRISKKNEKWFVIICLETNIVISRQNTGKAIGVDLGISHLVTTSEGKFFDSPKHYINGQKKLRILQRSIARKKKGSNNRKEAIKHLAKYSECIANKRNDFLHKLTFNLVKNNDLVVIEDLNLAFMNRNKHLAKASLDVAMGKFRQFLEYKAESAGVKVVVVDPKNTSQICSRCGKIVKKSLAMRTHNCNCGLVIDRDVNAAINILQRGASLLGNLTYGVSQSVLPQAVCFN